MLCREPGQLTPCALYDMDRGCECEKEGTKTEGKDISRGLGAS